MNQSASSIGHVLRPVAFINSAIGPDLSSSAMSGAFFPLAVIDSLVIHLIRTNSWKLSDIAIIIVIDELSNSVQGGLDIGVGISRILSQELGHMMRRSVLTIDL